MTTHLIEDISYSKDFILCKCGWKDKVELFQAHRFEFSEKLIKSRERDRRKRELILPRGLDE